MEFIQKELSEELKNRLNNAQIMWEIKLEQ